MPDFTTAKLTLQQDTEVDAHEISGTAVPSTDYRAGLVRYFFRHLGNREDAEDLAQEVFVRVAHQKPQQRINNVEAFVFRIASNLLKDRFRRNRSHRVQQHISDCECAQGRLGEAPSEENVYQQQERLKMFLSALDELPPRCRTVFLLQRYEGLTYTEVAQKLGISVSAVEKHMMKALLHFDSRMDPA